MNHPRNWTATLSAPDPAPTPRKRTGPKPRQPSPDALIPSGFSIGDTATMGRMLRGMRLRAGLTHEQLAERLQMGERAIRRRENDQQVPRLTEIEDWADVCGFVVRVGVEG